MSQTPTGAAEVAVGKPGAEKRKKRTRVTTVKDNAQFRRAVERAAKKLAETAIAKSVLSVKTGGRQEVSFGDLLANAKPLRVKGKKTKPLPAPEVPAGPRPPTEAERAAAKQLVLSEVGLKTAIRAKDGALVTTRPAKLVPARKRPESKAKGSKRPSKPEAKAVVPPEGGLAPKEAKAKSPKRPRKQVAEGKAPSKQSTAKRGSKPNKPRPAMPRLAKSATAIDQEWVKFARAASGPYRCGACDKISLVEQAPPPKDTVIRRYLCTWEGCHELGWAPMYGVGPDGFTTVPPRHLSARAARANTAASIALSLGRDEAVVVADDEVVDLVSDVSQALVPPGFDAPGVLGSPNPDWVAETNPFWQDEAERRLRELRGEPVTALLPIAASGPWAKRRAPQPPAPQGAQAGSDDHPQGGQSPQGGRKARPNARQRAARRMSRLTDGAGVPDKAEAPPVKRKAPSPPAGGDVARATPKGKRPAPDVLAALIAKIGALESQLLALRVGETPGKPSKGKKAKEDKRRKAPDAASKPETPKGKSSKKEGRKAADRGQPGTAAPDPAKRERKGSQKPAAGGRQAPPPPTGAPATRPPPVPAVEGNNNKSGNIAAGATVSGEGKKVPRLEDIASPATPAPGVPTKQVLRGGKVKHWAHGSHTHSAITSEARVQLFADADLVGYLQMEVGMGARTPATMVHLRNKGKTWLKENKPHWNMLRQADQLNRAIGIAMTPSTAEQAVRQHLKDTGTNAMVHKAHNLAQGDLGNRRVGILGLFGIKRSMSLPSLAKR